MPFQMARKRNEANTMFKVEFDISEEMDMFHYFAKRGDKENAALQVAILAKKYRLAPLSTLDQIIKANGNRFDVEMAKEIKADVELAGNNLTVADKLDVIILTLKEARHNGNKALIKHYCKVAQTELQEVIDQV